MSMIQFCNHMAGSVPFMFSFIAFLLMNVSSVFAL